MRVLLTAVLLVALPAWALNILPGDDSSGGDETLRLEGEFRPGDFKRLAAIVAKQRVTGIEISSKGGDLIEAIRIGILVREAHIGVSVTKGAVCASACFFVLLGSTWRTAAGIETFVLAQRKGIPLSVGMVGLHRPYQVNPTSDEKSLQRQNNSMKKVRNYLESQLVSSRLIDLMMTRPSNDIYWLTDADLDELGEHPPAIEELYISKCKYNRKDIPTYVQAQKNHDVDQVEAMSKKLQAVSLCKAMLDLDAWSNVAQKLRQGWLPQSPV